MSRLTTNILANLSGQSWSVIVSIAVIPLYIKFLGIEAYGLLGFYMMLQGALQILDLGLSPTMNRELARYSTMPEKAGEARDLVRTLEVGYWLIGIVAGGAVSAAAPLITHKWLNIGNLPSEEVQQALMMMGLLVALQWPLSFYGSGLMGLQKQVLVNSIGIPMSLVGSGGAVLVLWLVSPKVTSLLGWQIMFGVLQLALVAFLLWRNLPTSGRPPRFNLALLRNVWRFAVGMGGIALSSVILTQLDKLILSRILSLEMFGYYTLASSAGRGLYVFITPMFNAIFPRFSALVAGGELDQLRKLYHQASQAMAALVLPVAAVMALFSFDLLKLWLRSEETASMAAPIVSILVIGTALNGLLNLPYALQLAFGWTRLSLYINAGLIVALVPAIIVMASAYGAVGAAVVWVALNLLYFIVGVPLTHRWIMRGEGWQWFVGDMCRPLAATLVITGLARWLVKSPMPTITTVANLTLILTVAALGSIMVSPYLRTWMFDQWLRLRAVLSC